VKRGGRLKRTTGLARGKGRMKAVSDKRAALLPERDRVRAVVLARDRTCRAEFLVPAVVCRGALAVHEPLQRSLSSTSWLDPDQAIALCRAHHNYVHDHIAESLANGLLRNSWDES
jgi:hypothetical protein